MTADERKALRGFIRTFEWLIKETDKRQTLGRLDLVFRVWSEEGLGQMDLMNRMGVNSEWMSRNVNECLAEKWVGPRKKTKGPGWLKQGLSPVSRREVEVTLDKGGDQLMEKLAKVAARNCK